MPLHRWQTDDVHLMAIEAPLLTLSPGDPLDADPPEDEHGAVMVDVEEADLGELLPQDEEDGVQELHSFGDVVPPESRCYLETSDRGWGGVNYCGSCRTLTASMCVLPLSCCLLAAHGHMVHTRAL